MCIRDSFTSEQLDVLCDPTKPAEVMNAMRTGMTYGLDTQTVTRLSLIHI